MKSPSRYEERSAAAIAPSTQAERVELRRFSHAHVRTCVGIREPRLGALDVRRRSARRRTRSCALDVSKRRSDPRANRRDPRAPFASASTSTILRGRSIRWCRRRIARAASAPSCRRWCKRARRSSEAPRSRTPRKRCSRVADGRTSARCRGGRAPFAGNSPVRESRRASRRGVAPAVSIASGAVGLVANVRAFGRKLSELRTFDERADVVWNACAARWPVVAKRDREWLAWRWDACPS